MNRNHGDHEQTGELGVERGEDRVDVTNPEREKWNGCGAEAGESRTLTISGKDMRGSAQEEARSRASQTYEDPSENREGDDAEKRDGHVDRHRV